MRFLILVFCFYVTHATVVVAPPKCPCNEVYSTCKDPCPVTCNAITTGEPGPDCVRPNPCKGGCNCADGYVRNHCNKCILENDCPCPSSNATLVDCPNPCPRTCDNLQQGGVIPCGRMCIRKGCTCKDGFVQNADGNCIKPEDCPPQDCPENEEWNSCPGFCNFEEDCMYVFGARRSCMLPPPGVEIPCQPQCRCKAGFVRIADGTCASADKCCEAPSSVLSSCPAPCERTCSVYPEPDCKEDCSINKCICAPTYVRNEGKCIPENDCPCDDPNSVYQYFPRPCPPTCDFPDGRIPCPIAGLTRGCACKEGFIRDANGICITPDKCPPPTCPGKNEVYVSCKDQCPATCNDITGGPARSCSSTASCHSGCICNNGFIRNKDDVCVKYNDCPCPDPNAFMTSCPNPCPPTCDQPNQIPCTKACIVRGCTCKDGYVYDANHKCIKPNQCPKKCPANEVLNSSPKACVFEPDCLSVFGIVPTCSLPLKPLPINPRCECKEGLVRQNGLCVSPAKCCTVPNTKLVNCPAASEATCSNSPVAGSKDACKGKKCVCNDGYVREGLKCILKKDCPPKCSKPNEEYLECGSPCQATCENREPLCKAKCGPGCFCKKGYVRNNGNCIAIKDCKPCTPVPKC
nr:zonadhesin-like protein 8 [Limnephilus flavicornis]